MSKRILRRYTNLAATLHLLRNKCLTLLSPDTWDDRNDSFFLRQYKEKRRVASVLSLCFTETEELYHHWRIFAPGNDGVCLEFNKEELLSAIAREPLIEHRMVEYLEINAAKKSGILVDDLPFRKRWPYKDDVEFRLLYVDPCDEHKHKDVPLPLKCINRVTLSPWLPLPLLPSVKDTIHEIPGCSKLKVYRSTLIENEKWKRIASGA